MTGLFKISIAFILFVAAYLLARRRARRGLEAERVVIVRKKQIDTQCVMCHEPSNGMPLCDVCAGPPW